jgi:uncharacterized protein (TIGR03546 family)
MIRGIGKLLRGRATPLQIILAAALGGMIGFLPGFSQAAGLTVALLLLLVLLNANLFVAGIIGLVAKLISLLALPLSFEVGRWLLDGPAQSLFKRMINAPVLALFGFEYYATTGGLALGLIFGLICGFALVIVINSFRRKMAQVEEGSALYQKYASKRWVRVASWALVGKGKGRKSYAELLDKRFGNPIRPLGAVFAVLVAALLWVGYQFFSGPIVTAALRCGLERANGATVDLDAAELDLKQGRMTITGLAMADPNDLSTDLIRASKVEADISGVDLLRKRIAMDRVELTGSSTGDPRTVPGRLVRTPPTPTPDTNAPPKLPDEKQIEEYIDQAKAWKQRLAQVRQWLEKLSGPAGQEQADTSETLEERLRREADQLGFARVRATHLIDGAPTLAIYELLAADLKSRDLPDETITIRGENLSTHPHLLGKAPRIEFQTSKGTIAALASLAAVADPGGVNQISLHYRGLDTDSVAQHLTVGGHQPIRGGTMDLALDGRWSRDGIDLPLNVTLHDPTLEFAGGKPTKVDQLSLPIGLRGPIDNPRIRIDNELLADALVKAGAGELARRVQGEVDERLQEATKDLTDKINEKLSDKLPGGIKSPIDPKKSADDALRGLLGGADERD